MSPLPRKLEVQMRWIVAGVIVVVALLAYALYMGEVELVKSMVAVIADLVRE